ncbi:MAG: sigma-70 family RNA polymerase sigma factor [Polyangiaceae bacterium]
MEPDCGVADGWPDPLVRPTPPPASTVSFDEIYRTFFDDVCRWVRALGGPDADREDLVQDVFVIVHRRLGDFDGQNLAGWIYRITRHRVRDFRRLRWFRLFLSAPQADDSIPGPASSPEQELGTKESEQLLTQLLSRLSESQRAAFVLFEIEGYSGEEIARLQHVPINTVWARIYKARAKLAAGAARLRRER